jgi:F0F1-type ATP synthase membrane subunit b/b'
VHASAQGEHGEGHGEEHAGASIWGTLGRLFNFAVLAGALVYLLRSPFAAYLRDRSVSIRSDLKKAAETREGAARQLAEIEARMRALPDEVAALTRRGAEEIAAEEARIMAAAETERARMLEQSRREIDLQVRLAQRSLRRLAGELAVNLATERVRRSINEADHARLVDRYLAQVQPPVPSGTGGRPS